MNMQNFTDHKVLPKYLQAQLIEASKIEDAGKRRKAILEIEKMCRKLHGELFKPD